MRKNSKPEVETDPLRKKILEQMVVPNYVLWNRPKKTWFAFDNDSRTIKFEWGGGQKQSLQYANKGLYDAANKYLLDFIQLKDVNERLVAFGYFLNIPTGGSSGPDRVGDIFGELLVFAIAVLRRFNFKE